MEEYNLREELKNIEDKRRGAGQRHKIDVILMITIMATMSGYTGFRAIGDFSKRYKKELIEYLKVEKDRLPAFGLNGKNGGLNYYYFLLLGTVNNHLPFSTSKIYSILYEF